MLKPSELLIWFVLFEDGAKLKITFEIFPPLCYFKTDLLVVAFYFDTVVSAKSDCRSASRDRIVVLPRSRRRLED